MKYSHQLQACEYSCLSSLLVIRDASFRRAWRNGCIRGLSHDSLPPTVLLRRQSGWVLDTCHEIENERKKGWKKVWIPVSPQMGSRTPSWVVGLDLSTRYSLNFQQSQIQSPPPPFFLRYSLETFEKSSKNCQTIVNQWQWLSWALFYY